MEETKTNNNGVKVIRRGQDEAERLRRERNEDIIKRASAGESIALVTAEQTWFPPRPIIKKDGNAIKRIYRPSDDDKQTKLLPAVPVPRESSCGPSTQGQ